IRFDNETAEAAMQIGQKTGAPMMTRGQRNFQRIERHGLPVIELVHNIKAEIVNEAANTHRHDDRLIGSDSSERSAIEMIKMRVCYQHQSISGKLCSSISGWFQRLVTFKHFAQFGSTRILRLFVLMRKEACPDQGMEI